MARPRSTPAKKPSTRRASEGKSGQNTPPDLGMPEGITSADLVDYYTRMVLVRTVDERIWA